MTKRMRGIKSEKSKKKNEEIDRKAGRRTEKGD